MFGKLRFVNVESDIPRRGRAARGCPDASPVGARRPHRPRLSVCKARRGSWTGRLNAPCTARCRIGCSCRSANAANGVSPN